MSQSERLSSIANEIANDVRAVIAGSVAAAALGADDLLDYLVAGKWLCRMLLVVAARVP